MCKSQWIGCVPQSKLEIYSNLTVYSNIIVGVFQGKQVIKPLISCFDTSKLIATSVNSKNKDETGYLCTPQYFLSFLHSVIQEEGTQLMWSIDHGHPSTSNDPSRFLILIFYLEYNILLQRKTHTSFCSFESFQRSSEWVSCLYYLL